MSAKSEQSKPFPPENRRKTAHSSRPRKSVSARESADTELLVLEDVDNGNEYYMAVVDTFLVGNREYVALSSYEPDDGQHRDPEFVLMRFAEGPGGEHYYQSIRSKKELNLAFKVFFDRYIEHL